MSALVLGILGLAAAAIVAPTAFDLAMDALDRRWAIARHREKWTHGQIAEHLGRNPAVVARWLSDHDAVQAGRRARAGDLRPRR